MSGSDRVQVDVGDVSQLDSWARSWSDFLSGANGCAEFVGKVAVSVASPAVLAGNVTVGMASPADAGAASLADLADVVTVEVTPSAVAGVVTVGVASLADAGVASLADAGVASPADLAGVVTIGVASLTDAGVVSLADTGVASMADAWVTSLADARVASLADAEVGSLANLAGSVAGGGGGGVTHFAVPVCVSTEEMMLLQECVVRDHSVFYGSVFCDSEMDCRDCMSPDAWCQGMPEIREDWVDQTVLEGGDDYLVGTLSSEPLCVITDDMT